MTLILFDLDDTLVDRRTAFRAWAGRFCEEHGLEGGVGVLQDFDRHGYAPRGGFFARVAEHFSLKVASDELLRRYRDEFPSFVPRPREPVFERLRHLRAAGARIGIVTNGSAMQLSTIDATGLAPFIDGCCVSDLEGVRKPDGEIFRRAARRCGAPLQGGWMVGDNPEADVRGGHELGLRTIWLSHSRAWDETSYSPTGTAETLEDALAMLLGET